MMQSRQFRAVLPAAAVVVTILVAAFAQITLPRMNQLSGLRAEYEALSAQAAEAGPAPARRTVPEAREVVQFISHVQAVNAVIADPGSAYDRLVDLARRGGLRVESISPSHAEKENDRLDQFGWSMVATGSFAAIVEFVDALNSSEGLHRIASLRLAPAMGADSAAVTLNLNVEFVRLPVPETLLPAGERGGLPGPQEVSP